MSRTPRRTFLKQAAAASAALPLLGSNWARARGANESVNIACVGVGGKGHSDMTETSVGQNIVAICDIDEQRLDEAAKLFPKAKRYTDWRKMLEQGDIEAVTVSTPDHNHAAITMAAISQGLHAYTQKPLTHDVYEARQLAKAAAEHGVVTQMGIQHHSAARIKNAVQIIRDGAIGKVSEVHTWTDRPGSFWKQGLQRPASGQQPPAHIHWDQWLGTAPRRPYVPNLYHPFHWRGWWDFGTGAMGDMGCHILDPVVNALQLGAPKTVSAEGPEPDPESGPLWCVIDYEFPGTEHTTDTLKLTWYEAGKQPPRELFQAPDDWPGSQNGVLFVGERGNLFVGFPEPPQLFPVGEFTDYKMPELAEDNHYTQWTAAILGHGETTCPFSYSGPLTETVLLGNLAYRSGQKIVWDSETLTAQDNPAANALIRRTYREGWEVAGLS